ncbi:MAG: ABC transporter permease [Clostridia bacterium]|nr:ABC transporter permease [Clostridia bacterium]
MIECKKMFALISRNTKCYFKNKFMFFTSLITPLILLLLFATFLRNVYVESFEMIAAEFEITLKPRVLNGITGAWLMSSILSVSAVTVAFCSNIIMAEDKMNSIVNDFNVSPVKRTTISISYFVSNFFVTFIVIMSIMLIGHIYLAAVGWYIPVGDVFMIIVDCVCGILFGTLCAGIVLSFVSNQGGVSAVSTLISSMYGFICGAYMPLSQFSKGLRNFLGFLPGTYSVGIMRNHYMNGYVNEIVKSISDPAVAEGMQKGIKDGFDANLYVFGNQISLGAMYGILLGACAVLLAGYIAIIILKNKTRR